MFTLKLQREGVEDAVFEINKKDDFVNALGKMWDAVEETVNKKTEESFYNELLKNTPFETKEEFNDWMQMMKDYGFMVENFDWLAFREETVNNFIEEKTCGDYSDLDEMVDKIDEMVGDFEEIYDIARKY